jgi:hypothetical protein
LNFLSLYPLRRCKMRRKTSAIGLIGIEKKEKKGSGKKGVSTLF